MRTRLLGLSLIVAGTVAGCTGRIGDRSEGGPEATDPTGGSDPQSACLDATPAAGESPLRRLTRGEYINTVRDLLEIETDIGEDFVADELVAGFAANSVSSISKYQLETYLDASEELAVQALAAHQAEWLPCDVAETSCVAPFIAWMGKRAFRRPLAADLEDTLVALYEAARGQWGAAKAVELTLAAILDSPYFLYHLELTLGAGADLVPLDDFEIASRLSYFLWGSMPDDELMAAAEAGALATPEGVEEQARRMLDDPRAAQSIDSFTLQWLELDALAEQVKDPEAFPSYDEQLADAMRRETLTFVRSVVQEGQSASELLTATHTWVTPSLAAVYGVDPAGATEAEPQRVDLDPNERAGLLTQPAFLSSRAHAADTSWALRGKFVREKLLCESLPPPPPGVDQKAANDPNRLTSPECASCHQQMDLIGLGFENYDAIGRYRTEDESGEPIVAEGEVVGHEDIGAFVGAVDLAGALAESEAVKECLAKQYFRFASRRQDVSDDACSISGAYERFASAGYDVRELLVGIAASDAFRHGKPAAEGQ